MTRNSSRLTDGVLLVCKPGGVTSFDIVKRVKKLVRPLKVGHTGTLDPMATGLLPLTLGEATKLTKWLSGGDKRYKARIKLGASTDTLDRDGEVAETAQIPAFDRESLEHSLAKFRGAIDQIPPMYSALHHKGRRMYELAREGIEVERKTRQIQIHQLDLLGFDDQHLEIDVQCSAGTYIRSLAVDIASDLGTLGHLDALERTEAAGWQLSQASPVDELDRDLISKTTISLEDALTRYEGVCTPADVMQRLGQGQRLELQELEQLGLQIGETPRTIWFSAENSSIEETAIVLAELAPKGVAPPMKISRVLRTKKT